jgi:hypothetical protein
LPWWLLEPDSGNLFLTSGFRSGFDRAVAACAADRSFAIVYLPSLRKITLNLNRLAGPQIGARWYDTANGEFLDIEGSPFPAMGSQSFTRDAGENSAGSEDWALVLDSRPDRLPAGHGFENRPILGKRQFT